jgi:hypothetical protein
MAQISYLYGRQGDDRYSFISIGKRNITKVVDFSPTSMKNLFNLGFGDLLPDGSIDDTANSNNGDIVKVLTTVVEIIRDFTANSPDIKIIFIGSTDDRTKLYARILRMYFEDFIKEFTITAFLKSGDFYVEVEFDPQHALEYSGFFIKRND